MIDSPITPPPLPSQPGMGTLHTGHMASFLVPSGAKPSRPYSPACRCLAALIALNRHLPPTFPLRLVRIVLRIERENVHITCPQGVSVAFSGGEKQTGQVKAERAVGSSSSACAPSLPLPFEGKAWDGSFMLLSNSRMREFVGCSDALGGAILWSGGMQSEGAAAVLIELEGPLVLGTF